MAYVKKDNQMVKRGTVTLFFDGEPIVSRTFSSASHRRRLVGGFMKMYQLEKQRMEVFIHVLYQDFIL